MSGHKPFKNLSDNLRSTPEGRAAVQREQQLVRDILALAQLRAGRRVTQVELARAWETSQANVSRVEHAEDIYLSALRSYVSALGSGCACGSTTPRALQDGDHFCHTGEYAKDDASNQPPRHVRCAAQDLAPWKP